jgi:hypothetical protein
MFAAFFFLSTTINSTGGSHSVFLIISILPLVHKKKRKFNTFRQGLLCSSLRFDALGFLVERADGRCVSALDSPDIIG